MEFLEKLLNRRKLAQKALNETLTTIYWIRIETRIEWC